MLPPLKIKSFKGNVLSILMRCVALLMILVVIF